MWLLVGTKQSGRENQDKDLSNLDIEFKVFKDSSFASAVIKTNAIQVLKQFGINEVVSI